MSINEIIQKGESGQKLNENEIRSLMLHALDLLKQINAETLASIAIANAKKEAALLA